MIEREPPTFMSAIPIFQPSMIGAMPHSKTRPLFASRSRESSNLMPSDAPAV